MKPSFYTKIEFASKILGYVLYLIGIFWFLLLSQDEVNYKTYMSENALLVGLVDETFRADEGILKLYEKFKESFNNKFETSQLLKAEFEAAGLEVYEQSFTFSHQLFENAETYWAKDVIFLFPDMEYVGLLAWIDAYHGIQTSSFVMGSALIGRSGGLQAGLNIEFPSLLMDSLDVSYQGINGESPNLDLINSIVRLAQKLKVPLSLHGQPQWSTISDRVQSVSHLLSSVWVQASGSPTGLHGILTNFQIPALTLRGVPSIRGDVPSLVSLQMIGSVVEGFLRCLNNLQERFHQSFYYYLLPNLRRYISIGVFTPPFFVAIGGLAVQVLVVYAKLFLVEEDSISDENQAIKKSEKVANDDARAKPVDGGEPTDGEVRLRNMKKSLGKVSMKMENKDALAWLKLDRLVSALASALTSLGICLLGGACMHRLPEFVFAYMVPTGDPEMAWPTAERNCLVTLLAAFVLITLLLPVLAAVYKSRWLGYGQNLCLSRGLILLFWSVFLGCLSPLNISASLLLLVVMQPVLLFINLGSTRFFRVISCMLLLCVSPPMLLILASFLHPIVAQFPPVDLQSTGPASLGRTLLQSYLESHLLGSWTWTLGCTFVLPLWLFAWNGLILGKDKVIA